MTAKPERLVTRWLYGQMGTDATVPRTESPAARLFKDFAMTMTVNLYRMVKMFDNDDDNREG